jgi:uncharacterized membrane protein
MSDLIAIVFDNTDDARAAMARLREQEHLGRIKFEDTAIVERDLDGTVRVKNEASGTTEAASLIGALLGGLVAFMFPVAGIAIGAGAGAAVGAAFHSGVNGTFVAEVKEQLKPGRSALLLAVNQGSSSAISALRGMPGEVVQTTLDQEAEDALIAALRR